MFDAALKSPLRFFLAAAVLAAILCLFPARVEELEPGQPLTRQETAAPVLEQSANADLSQRTGAGCRLHRTMIYAPCGHSVQSREKLPAQLAGMSRELLEQEIAGVIPGASVTGFSGDEVDITVSADIPCPLHWVLRIGEDGMLHVLQNRDGRSLEAVRRTEVSGSGVSETERAALLEGKIFDDVQEMEGYLESISS